MHHPGRRGHARAHALAYTAGVLASFLALGALMVGLRAAGEQLGWGFQLQSPAVVATLAAAVGHSADYGLGHAGGPLLRRGLARVERALENFFTEDNLSRLREIALEELLTRREVHRRSRVASAEEA